MIRYIGVEIWGSDLLHMVVDDAEVDWGMSMMLGDMCRETRLAGWETDIRPITIAGTGEANRRIAFRAITSQPLPMNPVPCR